MKKYLLIAAALLTLAPMAAQARSIDEVNFHIMSSNDALRAACNREDLPEIYGCFSKPNDIYLRSDLPGDSFMFDWVLRHEVGHFFMQDVTDWTVIDNVQNEEKAQQVAYMTEMGKSEAEIQEALDKWEPNYEQAADMFASWSMYPNIGDPAVHAFFEQVMASQ